MIYVQNNLNFTRIAESVMLSNSETAWIVVENHCSVSQNSIIGVVYRHPKKVFYYDSF